MTKRFELINPKIEGADTVKLVKDLETGKEYTLKEIVRFMNCYEYALLLYEKKVVTDD